MRKNILILCVLATMSIPSMAQKYHVKSIERERILIDSRYADDAEGNAFLAPYKQKVDSVMSPVVGRTARYMKSYRPESELSNLLADIMVWCGSKYNEKPDIGIYNMGGIRAALPEGDITFGDITDMAPFENKICFLSLTGAHLTELFKVIGLKGAGVSHGIEAKYKGKEMVSLTLNGEPIDAARSYRIATIDYLVQGNDGFRELSHGTDVNSPQDAASNTRYLITDFFRSKMAAGESVDAEIEGRVIIEE